MTNADRLREAASLLTEVFDHLLTFWMSWPFRASSYPRERFSSTRPSWVNEMNITAIQGIERALL